MAEFDLNIVSGDIIIDVAEERCVVVGIVPSPGGKSVIVILAVELQSLDVFLDDMFELGGASPVLDVKSALIVAVDAVDNLIILNFELLDFAIFFIFLVILLVGEDGAALVLVFLALPGALLVFHFCDHVGFKPAGEFQQFGDVFPVDGTAIVDKLFMLHQILLVLVEQGVHVIVLQHEAEFHRQEIISHECHQQHQIVDDVLYFATLHAGKDLFELLFEVFPKDVDHH